MDLCREENKKRQREIIYKDNGKPDEFIGLSVIFVREVSILSHHKKAKTRIYFSSSVNKRTSSTGHFKIEHKSFKVMVLIGLLCLRRSKRLRLIPCCVISLYVEMFLLLRVL